MKSKKNILLVSLLALSIVPVGQSTWITIFDDSSKSYSKSKSDVTKVAYTINDSKVITYYLTIESALEHTTSGTIYVIPGTNPTITRDCEIKSGVTLCIPYDDNGDGTHSDFTNLENQSDNGFADKDATAVAKNRKNLVTVKEGITLTNNGTLDVAGKVGVGADSNQRPSGFTLGDYCEILMESNSTIVNNGTINLYGYIKESSSNNGSSVEHSETGSIKMPFTIYDFMGGSYSSDAITKGKKPGASMPFNYFDLPNCHVKQTFNCGAKLTGVAVLYANNAYNSSEALILGDNNDNCLFKLANGKLTYKYEPVNCLYTTADVVSNTNASTANYTRITIDGDFEFGAFVIKLKVYFTTYTFNSAEYECPVCYKYQIYQNSGTLSIPNKMKFLSGSSLTIGKNAKCIMSAATTFYQGYSPFMTIAKNSPKMGRAKFLVNGDLTINASFGGLINSDNSTGTVTTGDNFEDTYVSTEQISSGSGIGAWSKHIEYAEAYTLVDDTQCTFRLEKGQTYNLSGYYWSDSNYTDISSLTLDKPYGTSSSNSAQQYTVTASYDFVGYDSKNVKLTWAIDDDSVTLSSKDNAVTFTTPAATDAEITYNLTCTVSFNRKDGSECNISLSGLYIAQYTSSGGGCILPTTKVLMADGTYKPAGLIEKGDKVISFNHETGKLETNVVIVNAHKNEETKDCNVLHLTFSNGNTTDLVYKHGYFDLTLNKYVYLSIDNYLEYIGHEFAYVDSKLNRIKIKLVSGEVKRTHTKVVSPVTANHLNLIADNILSLSSSMDGLFNIFEYDPATLAFDKDKMQKDIDKYGLLGYKAFEQYFPKKIYDLLPCKYLGVSIGKGLITWNTIEQYITRWKDQLLENM